MAGNLVESPNGDLYFRSDPQGVQTLVVDDDGAPCCCGGCGRVCAPNLCCAESVCGYQPVTCPCDPTGPPNECHYEVDYKARWTGTIGYEIIAGGPGQFSQAVDFAGTATDRFSVGACSAHGSGISSAPGPPQLAGKYTTGAAYSMAEHLSHCRLPNTSVTGFGFGQFQICNYLETDFVFVGPLDVPSNVQYGIEFRSLFRKPTQFHAMHGRIFGPYHVRPSATTVLLSNRQHGPTSGACILGFSHHLSARVGIDQQGPHLGDWVAELDVSFEITCGVAGCGTGEARSHPELCPRCRSPFDAARSSCAVCGFCNGCG